MTMAPTKEAVVLLNLGGPATLSDVKKFLYRLFDDPEIIRIKFPPLRKFVAWAISTSRHTSSQALYRKIGGGSPIRRLTEAQAQELEKKLHQSGRPARVRVAFSCSDPFIADVIQELSREGINKFILLPLFPQYSLTTTKGVLAQAQAAINRFAPQAQMKVIRSYPTHPLFIQAHADLIRELGVIGTGSPSTGSRNKLIFNLFREPVPKPLPARSVHLLFSAHSIPEKLVTEFGDPYRDETNLSVQAILKELNWTGPWSLSWQSKLGPVKWLGPSTIDEVRRLGASGVKTLVVVPISFVTDHLETLYELDQLIADIAKQSGIEQFIRVPGLNSHPTLIDCLSTLVTN